MILSKTPGNSPGAEISLHRNSLTLIRARVEILSRRNDLSLERHLILGYFSRTVRRLSVIDYAGI